MPATAGYSTGVDVNLVSLEYAIEATWGTNPGGAFQALRFTSESLSGKKRRDRPAEIGGARQMAAAVTTQESADGSIAFALSYGTYDDLLACLLGADWNAALNIMGSAGDISAAAAGNQFTSTTANKFSAVQVGQYIKTSGFTNNANNGWFRVTAKPNNQTLTVVGGTLVNETPSGTNAKINGQMIRNGTLFKSVFMQKRLSNALFLHYPGSYIVSGTLSSAVGQFFNGSFDVLSRSESSSTTDAAGSVTPAPSGRVHDPVSGFQALWLDNAGVSGAPVGIELRIANDGAQAFYAMGSSACAGMAPGMLSVSGRLQIYFKDFTLYTRFKNETAGPLAFRTADANGAAYWVTVLNANLMNPRIVAGGPNTAVLSEFDIEGNPDSATNATIQIDKAA